MVPFPADDCAESVAAEYLTRFQPAVVASSEKITSNPPGVAFYASGVPTPPAARATRVEHLFDLAAERRIPSMGITDDGNGIGCDLIFDAVRQHKQWGAACQCLCGGGRRPAWPLILSLSAAPQTAVRTASPRARPRCWADRSGHR
jgi:hypothetical protein